MAHRLVLTKEQAKSVIHMSENKRDAKGNVGHTKARHIDISRADLLARMEDGPSRNDKKDVFWRAAFLTVDSAADILSQAIFALAANPFVARFSEQADGTTFYADADVGSFMCRDMRGRFPAHQVHIFASKMTERPYGLHLITLYPILRF